jgi:diguanylate cyclase (GGDEF)-like protein/PAS domain S-box-containing protein
MKRNMGFTPQTNRAYLSAREFLPLGYLRTIFAAFILLYSAFSYTDRVYFPDAWQPLFFIRFGIVVPVLIVTLALSYHRTFFKVHQIVLSICFVLGGAGIATMLILIPDNVVYYGGLFLVYFSGYFLIKLRFHYATAAGWTIFLFHLLGHWTAHGDLGGYFLVGMFFFLSANLIGMFGSYHFEMMNRRKFLHDRQIAEINHQLVLQVEEKAKQYDELVKAIEERKELAFRNQEKDRLTALLKQSEEQYKRLATQMPLGLALHEIIVDEQEKPKDYRFLSINDGFERLTGLKRGDILGKTLLEVLPETEKVWIDTYGRVAQTGEPVELEEYSAALKRHFHVHAYSPKKGQFATIVEDVTERVEIQVRLQEQKKDLIATQNIAKIGSWRLNVKTNEVVWTEELYRMYGFDSSLPPPPYTEHMKLFTPDSWTRLSNALELTVRFGIPYDLELQTVLKNGKTGWMWVHGEAERDEYGQIAYCWGAAQDITERIELNRRMVDSEERYRLLYSSMTQGLSLQEIIVDENNRPIDYLYLDVNDSYCAMLGMKREDFIGKRVLEVFPKTETYWIQTFGEVALTGKSTQYENYFATTGRYYHTTAYCPKPRQFALLVTDITEQKQIQSALTESRERFQAIFEQSPLAIEFYDAEGRLMYANEASIRLFGVQDKVDLERYTLFDNPNLSPLTIQKLRRYEAIHEEILYDYEKVHQNRLYRTANTGVCILNVSITPLFGQGRLNGYLLQTEDITIERSKQKEVEYLSYHDYLTNVYNRRYLVDSFQALVKAEAFPIGIMMMDVNGLKIINDAYGHGAGDAALMLIAECLKDYFGDNGIVCRIGGDEFAVLVPRASLESLQNDKDGVEEALGERMTYNLHMSLAIGFDLTDEADKTLDSLLMIAENKMYRHKLSEASSVRSRAIQAIMQTLTEKYQLEKDHSGRVSGYVRLIGEALELKADDIKELEMAGMFHDIGKISIPDSILNKPDRLTKDEYEVVKAHTETGYQILRAADEYSDLAIHALYHHENWNGTGYPKGLKELEIPLFSRIISVADAYEAMTSDRPYRKAMDPLLAIDELKRNAGIQFDPDIVHVFLEKVLNGHPK